MTQRFFLFKFEYVYIANRLESQTKIKMSCTPKMKNISIEEKYEIIQAKQKGMSTKEKSTKSTVTQHPR